jgi:hypothetical protein
MPHMNKRIMQVPKQNKLHNQQFKDMKVLRVGRIATLFLQTMVLQFKSECL